MVGVGRSLLWAHSPIVVQKEESNTREHFNELLSTDGHNTNNWLACAQKLHPLPCQGIFI